MTTISPAAPTVQATQLGAWTVALAPGFELWNINERIGWRVAGRITRAIRRAGRQAAEDAGLPGIQRAHIFGYLHPIPKAIRRDPANWYPSFKAFVDGLVDAGVLPDDDSRHVLGPDMRLGRAVEGTQLSLLIIELPPLEVAT